MGKAPPAPLPGKSQCSVSSGVVRFSGVVEPAASGLRPESDPVHCLQFRDIVLDPSSHSVVRRGREIRASAIEFRLLTYLLSNVGRVVTREELFNSVWEAPPSLPSRTIDVHMARLRRALGANGGHDLIRTVRGKGYALGDATERVSAIPVDMRAVAKCLPAGDLTIAPVFSPDGVPCPGGIELDPKAKRAARLGRVLRLSPKEFGLLELLISNCCKLLTREQIADAIGANDGAGRAIDKTVERLRRAINHGSLPDPICSVLGAGYKFSPDPSVQIQRSPAHRRTKAPDLSS